MTSEAGCHHGGTSVLHQPSLPRIEKGLGEWGVGRI